MKLAKDGSCSIRSVSDAQTLKILVSGDLCPRTAGEKLIREGKSADIVAPILPMFQNADLSILQFETTLTTADTPIIKSGPNLRCHPDTVQILHELNPDITLLANNHTGDYGPAELVKTIDILKANGFKTVGAGNNLEESRKPLIVENKNITIAVINVAEHEFGTATDDTPGTAPLDPPFIIRQILTLRKQADIVLVVVHGGNEHNPVPSPRVIGMMRAFAEAGASMIVNIHTHCPQGIEIWKDVPIVYSLGNFYFPWKDSSVIKAPDDFWLTGYSVEFTVDKGGCLGFKVIPSTFSNDATAISPITGRHFDGFIQYLQKISDIIPDEKLVNRLYDCWVAMSSYPQTIINPSFSSQDFCDNAPEHRSKLVGLRNLFTCEAHNELMTRYMRLCEEGKLQEVLSLKDTIKDLQKASFML